MQTRRGTDGVSSGSQGKQCDETPRDGVSVVACQKRRNQQQQYARPAPQRLSSENKRDVFDIAVLIKRRLLNFALVAFQDVVEIGGDREGFAFGREILGGHIDKELAPARLVELRLDC